PAGSRLVHGSWSLARGRSWACPGRGMEWGGEATGKSTREKAKSAHRGECGGGTGFQPVCGTSSTGKMPVARDVLGLRCSDNCGMAEFHGQDACATSGTPPVSPHESAKALRDTPRTHQRAWKNQSQLRGNRLSSLSMVRLSSQG